MKEMNESMTWGAHVIEAMPSSQSAFVENQHRERRTGAGVGVVRHAVGRPTEGENGTMTRWRCGRRGTMLATATHGCAGDANGWTAP